MMHSVIFVIAGQSAAGKTTLAGMLSNLLGQQALNSGDLLRAYMRKDGIKVEDELATGDVFLDRFDERTAGEVIVRGADTAGATIIDGVRLFSSLGAFARQGIKPQVIVVSASLKIRYARLQAALFQRGETATALSIAHTLDRQAAWDRDLSSFRRVARWQFENDGPLELLEDFARSIAAEVK